MVDTHIQKEEQSESPTQRKA
jgi:hypothetical protein